MRRFALLLVSAVLAAACAETADDVGEDGSLAPLPPPGKEDGQYHAGLSIHVDSSRTDVWKVRNQWEDTDTAEARAAGIAWSADSGLTWDEKFGKWIASLEWAPSLDGYSMTVKVTT